MKLKKILGIVFGVLAAVMDAYSLICALNKFDLSKGIQFIIVIVNLVLLGVCCSLIWENMSLRRRGNIRIDDIVLTVISQKNIHRKKIDTVEINRIEYQYVFSKRGFDAYMRFAGTVTKPLGELEGITFNFSGDSNQSFESLDTYAYDLIHDPQKKNKIKGSLGENNGLNKDVLFKFMTPLKRNEKFDMQYHYRWNDCVNPQKDYIAAIPPFSSLKNKSMTLKVDFLDQKVSKFEVYSVYNAKAYFEANVFSQQSGPIQTFSHEYHIEEGFDFAVAEFWFE